MDKAQVFQIISLVGFILAGLAFAFAAYWFFSRNIFKVINDLTGRNAKKAIEKRRRENEESGAKSHRPTAAAQQRGEITSKMPDMPNAAEGTEQIPAPPQPQTQPTAPMPAAQQPAYAPLPSQPTVSAAPTEPIPDLSQSIPEGGAPTEFLADGTELLNGNTALLTETDTAPAEERQPVVIKVIQDIVLISTNETI